LCRDCAGLGVSMRLLVISPYPPPPDGIGVHTRSLAAVWASDGHEVHVVARAAGGAAETATVQDGVQVHRLLGRGLDAGALVDAVRPEAVFVQFAIPSLTTAWPAAVAVVDSARAAGAPALVAFHEALRELDLLGPVARRVYRAVARRTDIAVAFSSGGQHALEEMGFADVHLLPLGVPELAAVDDGVRAEVAARYAVSRSTLLSLGFTHPDKGVDVLVEACGLLRRSGTDVDLLVAGATRRRRGPTRALELIDARYDRAIRRAAERAPAVRFTGFVPDDDLPALLSSVGALALPYRRTTQSAVAGLALATGLPTVASDLAGLRDTLGDSALYTPAGDVAALAAAVQTVLKDDAQTTLRPRAWARAQESTVASVARTLVALISDR